MLTPENKVLSCEQCGQPLGSGGTLTGCLNCLLLGGLGSGSATRESSPAATTRTRFYQHYEIFNREDGALWELGRGAMGVTYKAIDVNLQMDVALKVIAAKFSAHPEARARFLREARTAAKLQHPNVAGVHHFGTISFPSEIGDGTECFYAMEFIEGETLEAYVCREGPLRPVAALEIALQIAHALGAAERRGLVHRDLKPANIMLTTEGLVAVSLGNGCPPHDDGDAWVKVIDFGLAKAIRRALGAGTDGRPLVDDAPLTQGGFMGTPQFASPEQFAGGELDARSDIFSLGVTLWYALTGELPFDGESLAEVRDRQLHRGLPVAQLTDVGLPAPLVRLLGHMLSPDPAKRPPSAAALCERLRRCLTALSATAGCSASSRPGAFTAWSSATRWASRCSCRRARWRCQGWARRSGRCGRRSFSRCSGLGVAALYGWVVDRRAIGKTHLPRHLGRRLGFVLMALLPAALTAAFFLLRPAPNCYQADPARRLVQKVGMALRASPLLFLVAGLVGSHDGLHAAVQTLMSR